MKKTLLAIVGLLSLAKLASADSVSININAGILENTLGTTPVPVGSLVELIASPSGTFSAPTSTSYITGDNVLVGSFAMTAYNATPGLFVTSVNSLQLTATITSGESLLLRFYPSLTYANMPSAPTLATTYGQVRSTTAEFASDTSDKGWIVPSAGATNDLNYLTTSAGGTYLNPTANATGIVAIAIVPEPSTYALLGCGMIGLIALRKQCRRSAVVA